MRLRGAAARSKSVRTYTAWQRPTRRSRTIGSDTFAVLMVGLGQGSLSTRFFLGQGQPSDPGNSSKGGVKLPFAIYEHQFWGSKLWHVRLQSHDTATSASSPT